MLTETSSELRQQSSSLSPSKKKKSNNNNGGDGDDDDDAVPTSSSSSASSDSAPSDVDEEEPVPFRETARYQTWRKHTRDLYRVAMHFEPNWPCQSVQLLPYIERHASYSAPDGNHLMKMKLIAGTTTGGAEQQFVKVLELNLPVGPEPPRTCGTKVDEELNEVGGFGCAPESMSLQVALRFFHDGDVRRIRYMPTHPNVFLTASSNGNLYLFDNANLSHTKAPNQPPRPVLPPPPVEPASGSKDRYEKEMDAYRAMLKKQEKWDRQWGADDKNNSSSNKKSNGQHSIVLKASAAGNNICRSSLSLSASSPGAIAVESDNSNNVQHVVPAGGASSSSGGGGAVPTSCEWHPLRREGHLAAGFDSGCVAEWNFGAQPQRKASDAVSTIEPVSCRFLPDSALDVQYSLLDENVLAAACRDGTTYLFDLREPACNYHGAVAKLGGTVQQGEYATTVSWSPFDEKLLAVGYGSGMTRIWDLRGASHGGAASAAAAAASSSNRSSGEMKAPAVAFCSHKKGTEVTSLQWNPHDRAVIATGGDDGNVVWMDTLKQQCMFVHCGHTTGINDMCWSWDERFAGMMISADDAAIIAWSPRTHLLE